MATGTISAQEIGNGSGPVTLTKQSAAKAWAVVTYSSGTPSADASFNVTSLTDVNTGEVEHSMTTALATSGHGAATASPAANANRYVRATHTAAGTWVTLTTNSATTRVDEAVNSALHGDLA